MQVMQSWGARGVTSKSYGAMALALVLWKCPRRGLVPATHVALFPLAGGRSVEVPAQGLDTCDWTLAPLGATWKCLLGGLVAETLDYDGVPACSAAG